MATGLVKWWRARFLAGYKPFSVVGGGAEGSDAEELLTGVTTPSNSPPPPPTLLTPPESSVASNSPNTPTSPVANEEKTNSHTTRQLSFEEFECDVSVTEGDRRRQEFSFTLYDLDGHGKITKDDIAGLVTTIYDTLGASIQVPPCGSKTIKVKLTVSPDQRNGQPRTAAPANSSNLPASGPTNPPCCHMKHVSSYRQATTHSPRRGPRRRRVPRHRCQAEHQVADSHSEDDTENTPANRSKQEELRKRVGPVPHLPSPYSNSSEGDVSDDSDVSPSLTPLTPLVPNQRKRSGAMQRQQLLEIIQANMEKNNLSFHTSRKRHQNDQPRISFRSPYTESSSPYAQRCRPPPAGRQIGGSYHKPVREHHPHHATSMPKISAKSRGNLRKPRPHHDASQLTSPTNPARNCQPQPNVVTRNIANPSNHGSPQHTANPNTISNHSQRTEAQHVQSPLQSGKGGKKHQLKHATREQDQARAMAQVVRWLEREFSQGATAAGAGRKHVHEHIHHHYHHYHAEALV